MMGVKRADVEYYLLYLDKNIKIPPDYIWELQYWLDDGRSSKWIPYDHFNLPPRLEYRMSLPNELVYEVDVELVTCSNCETESGSSEIKTRGKAESKEFCCPICGVWNTYQTTAENQEHAWKVTRFWMIKLMEAIEKFEERSPVPIPYYLYASSGKGLHLHIFLNWDERSRTEQDFRIIRKRCSNQILSYMETDGLEIGLGATLDMSNISKIRQLIKIEGMYNRKNNRYKTLLTTNSNGRYVDILNIIPENRDDCYLIKPTLPKEIERWNIPFGYC